MKLLPKKLFLVSVVLFATMYISCGIDFGNSFPKDTNTGEIGYHYDEIELFFNFADLATRKYKWKSDDNFDYLSAIKKEIKYNVKTKNIYFNSYYLKEPVRSSAALMYPTASPPEGGWPLFVTMHHTVVENRLAPTNVLARNRDFSLETLSDFDPHLHPLLLAASTGYAVYQPDFLGLGASKEKMHPFMYSRALVDDVLKGLDATIEEYNRMKIPINTKKIVVVGFSHGGWLASHVYREININHSSKYTVVGGVSSAGVYDIRTFLTSFLQSERTSLEAFIPYTLHGYKAVNKVDKAVDIEINYDDIYNPNYAELDFDGMFSGNHPEKYIDNSLSSVISETYSSNFINNHQTDRKYASLWQQIQKDSIKTWKLSGKFYIIHHEKDVLIPISQVRKFITDLKGVSGQVQENIEEYIGEWGQPNSIQHESTAIIHYIIGLHWLLQFR